ncbi:MAG: L-serine ammonia-lyase, partial [Burkholderiales bacterium PBB5]
MAVSVFDLFKIGIGPSSSHTVGPMRAARLFVQRLAHEGALAQVARIQCGLYGSLGATGKGHGSDKAVLLGLLGEAPDTVDVEAVPVLLQAIRHERQLTLPGGPQIAFDEKRDLKFFRRETLPFHANGMRFEAFDALGVRLVERCYYSVGGGFIVSDEVAADGARQKVIAPDTTALPLPFHSAAELLALCAQHQTSIAGLMRRNEQHWRSDAEIDAGLLHIWQVMQDCVARGCRTDGTLPGGFKVKRRAAPLHRALCANPEAALRDPLQVLDWVNLYALAVNEENAAGGRVVTAPTNGAAGIVPAVLHYYARFTPGATEAGVVDFTNPAAAEWFAEEVIGKRMLDFGLDGWMADFGEYLPTDLRLFSGDPMQEHNRWPVRWAEVNARAVASRGKTGEILWFMRAGHTGVQAHCPLLWAGDQSVDFSRHDGIGTVITAALSSGLVGNAFSHSDVGGYTSLLGNVRTEELMLRWYELGAFSPVMRTHEG